MYTLLDKADRDFTRFLWLSNPDDPSSSFITFCFKVVLFGATCSPFMLNAAMNHHLNRNKSATSLDLLKNLYVDNVVSGCSSVASSLLQPDTTLSTQRFCRLFHPGQIYTRQCQLYFTLLGLQQQAAR